MKTILTTLWLAPALALGLCTAAAAQETVKSLRGDVPLNQEARAAEIAPWARDRDPIPRDYVQQPPLIPHKIDGYAITVRDNKCMDCHSWSRYKQVNATKISLTHFRDRATGTELADVSPARYFCVQCHVPQTDAKPLVQNNFKPVEAVRQKR
jgi:cytochrome c-type protein NapB